MQIFAANNDGFSVVKYTINIERVRYLRIHPVKWHEKACLRTEIYGCEGESPLTFIRDEEELARWGIGFYQVDT
jgi:hypothetical protein